LAEDLFVCRDPGCMQTATSIRASNAKAMADQSPQRRLWRDLGSTSERLRSPERLKTWLIGRKEAVSEADRLLAIQPRDALRSAASANSGPGRGWLVEALGSCRSWPALG